MLILTNLGLPPILFPEKASHCSYLYGAPYVFSSCTNSCSDKAILCPLSKLESDSCKNLYQQRKRVLTFATSHDNESYLSFLDYGRYKPHESMNSKIFLTPELFSCPNKKCIPFSKVCNLADDCGDGADEKNCFNHFKCQNSKEYTPISNLCNGIIDCADATDECNERCGKNFKIVEEDYLVIFGWTIGIMAAFLNTIAVIATAKQLFAERSVIKLSNLVFVLLIALGDLCVGIYLLTISIYDSKFKADDGKRFCKIRFNEWLSGRTCAILGVLSTFGSQLSLYAMTVLSVFRIYCLKSKTLRGAITWKIKAALVVSSSLLILGALLISSTPLINTAEDFFVNGLVYPGNPLLIGALDKEKHVKILQAHYGHFNQKGVLTWEVIRALVQGMFTTFNGPVFGKKIHFYGNSGVCLFKFFVTPDDPQRAYTWFIIVQNAVCFFVITFSYITIQVIVERSSKRSIKEKRKGKGSNKNAAMNRKITLMIATDFVCWIPFIVVCILHYTELMNATAWYSLFSIVFLPLNSVINPILYDTAGLIDFLKKKFSNKKSDGCTLSTRNTAGSVICTRASSTRKSLNTDEITTAN